MLIAATARAGRTMARSKLERSPQLLEEALDVLVEGLAVFQDRLRRCLGK